MSELRHRLKTPDGSESLGVLSRSETPHRYTTMVVAGTRPQDAAQRSLQSLQAPTGDRRGVWADAALIGCVISVGVLLPVAVAIWLHAWGIPRNDDWAYRLTALRFVSTGHLSFVRWGAMTLAGQILWAAPFLVLFGRSVTAPAISVAVLACLGLSSAYLLARLALPRRWALAAVVLVLASPGFLLNTASFMTDVPAFSAEMICLLLGIFALRSSTWRHWALLGLSLAVGYFGFSIRQFAVAAPIAVVVIFALRDRHRAATAMLLGVTTVLSCGAIYILTARLGIVPTTLGLPNVDDGLSRIGWMYFTLAFVLSPILLCLGPLRPLSRLGLLGAGITLILGVEIYHWYGTLFAGSYLLAHGAVGDGSLGPGRPDLFPAPVWALFNLVALFAGTWLSAIVCHSVALSLRSGHVTGSSSRPARTAILSFRQNLGDGQMLLTVFVVLAAFILVCYCVLVKAPVYDRYLYPIVLPMSSILLARRSGAQSPTRRQPQAGATTTGVFARRLGAALLFCILGISALLVTINSDAYDGALWAIGQAAVDHGASPKTVDAGRVWTGWYTPPVSPLSPTTLAHTCWVARNAPAASALEGPPDVSVIYNEFGFAVREGILLYRTYDPGCTYGQPRAR